MYSNLRKDGRYETTPIFVGLAPLQFMKHEVSGQHVWAPMTKLTDPDQLPEGVEEATLERCKCGGARLVYFAPDMPHVPTSEPEPHCPHGVPASECNACYMQSDFDYDSQRERDRF